MKMLIEFHRILKKYKIHKIKTIGDTYMAAGGIPVKNITNPIDVVMAALEMNMFLNQVRRIDGKLLENEPGHPHRSRDGQCHRERRRFLMISRAIRSILPTACRGWGSMAKILISVMTYELIKEFFICDYYGKDAGKVQGRPGNVCGQWHQTGIF
jgi:adenylate cyclase